MRDAFDLYRRFIGVEIRSQLQYRFSFFMDVISTTAVTITGFLTMALILQRFHNIGGWNLGEIAFLYGMVEAAFGTMDMIFSGFDYDSFKELVRLGKFDQLLLRPVNVTVQVMGSKFLLRRLGRMVQGGIIFGLAIHLVPIQWTPMKLFYLPFVFLSLVCFFGALFIIGSTLTFWTVQSIEAMNIFTYGGSEMMSYPMHIYPNAMRKVFTFILPAIFLNYYPALYFLDKPDPLQLPAFAPFLAPLVGIGSLMAALAFWRYGIRHYQSTGT